MTESAYMIADLVRDLRAVVRRTGDARAIVKEVVPLARRIAADASWLRPEFYECEEDQGVGITVLHAEPDDTLTVQTVAWLPGRGVLPHNHKTWGVVVGLDGVERNVTWRRRDDGSKPGYADLEAHHKVDVGPGEAIAFLPEDIHSVRNDGDSTTVSLHIYGRNLLKTGRSEFVPEEKIERPCAQRKRRPAG